MSVMLPLLEKKYDQKPNYLLEILSITQSVRGKRLIPLNVCDASSFRKEI